MKEKINVAIVPHLQILVIKVTGYKKGMVSKMKKLEIVTRPEKLDELRAILEEFGVTGLNIFHMEGYGNQKGYYEGYDATQNPIKLLPMIKVETVVDATIAGTLIEKISRGIRTGNYGDGKIFVYDVEDAIRIRTGDRGKQAL